MKRRQRIGETNLTDPPRRFRLFIRKATELLIQATFRHLAALGLAFFCGANATRAQWTYVDVTDPIQQGGINTFHAENNQPNSWGMGSDGDADTTSQWRFRNTGPGVPAWNGTAYTGRYADGDPAIYTTVSGLAPDSPYSARVYGVFPSNPSSRFGAEFSLDGGSTWTLVDNKDWSLLTWVGNSTELGVPLADQTPSGDTRFYIQLPGELLTDADGMGRVDLRLPEFISDGAAQDKFNIDGYAFLPVSEPPVFEEIILNPDGTVTLRWTGGGALQRTPSLSSPDWTPISDAVSPHTLAAVDGAAFFRVAQ